MKAQQKLHQHLQELERGEAFSHERMKDMAELIDSLASPLPVMRIEDVELQHNHCYSVKLALSGGWEHDMDWDNETQTFHKHGTNYSKHLTRVTHVVHNANIRKALNASIQEES